jgi:branched-chain amino acid transport system permease protein
MIGDGTFSVHIASDGRGRKGGVSPTMDLTILVQQLFSGVSSGVLLFIVSSGLTLVFGVTRIINFAHGSFFMVSAFFAWTVTQWLNFWIALLIVPLVVAIAGGMIELFLFRRIYRAEHLFQLLLTYAVVFIIGDITKVIWGLLPKSSSPPEALSGSVLLFGVVIPEYRAFLLGLGCLIMIGLWYFLNRTKIGKYIRAAAQDSEMTAALGVNVPRLFTVVFMIGTWLAALGGVVSTPIITIILGVDISIIIQCFIVIIIGGMGSIGGAVLGALAIGTMEALGFLIVPRFVIILVYVLMALVLIFRPQGFLGRSAD